MIYLFDDTSDQYIKKYIDFVAYEGFLVRYSRLSMEEFSSIRDGVCRADCICIHRSIKDSGNDNSTQVFDDIVRNISDNGRTIPLVIFSGGDKPEPDFKRATFLREINKDLFYGNLKVFLDNYRDNGVPNLMCLAHGRNVDANLAISEAQAILKKIRFKSAEDVLAGEWVSGANLMAFVGYSQPGIGCTYGEIISDIDSGKISVGSFREKINTMIKSFSDYGKNVHSWR